MKTRNSKLQKTELFSLINLIVLTAAILVISIYASANENSIHLSKGTEAFADILSSERESEMNLESWMLNSSNFYHAFELETSMESALAIEGWMTDANNFFTAFYVEPVAEEALNISEWMVDEAYFAPAFSLETETEEALKLENWMIDIRNFALALSLEQETEEELNLEQWMLDENTFYIAPDLATDSEDNLIVEDWMVSDTAFNSTTYEAVQAETLAMTSEKSEKPVTTLTYTDPETGYTFLFTFTEIEEPELKLEKWMLDKKHWNRK